MVAKKEPAKKKAPAKPKTVKMERDGKTADTETCNQRHDGYTEIVGAVKDDADGDSATEQARNHAQQVGVEALGIDAR